MSDELIREIPCIGSIQEIGGNYDAWLVDLWGVMHDGANAIEEAVFACERYREEGGIVVLLSNAPRPWLSVRDQIEGYGVPSSVDDGIVTSGDVTRFMLAANEGARVYHIGPERDRSVFDGLDLALGEPENADLVLLSGLYDDTTETPEDYRKGLRQLLEHELPMICANPDIKVERSGEVIYAAGAIARIYEEIGGKVLYAGKPHRPIYDLAMAKINEQAGREVPVERILAIGDGMDTDIKGAVNAGIDAVFVPTIIHLDDEQREHRAVAELFSGKPFRPMAWIHRLQW